MAQFVHNYGRYQVVENTLSDRSKTYDVRFVADSGQTVTIACSTDRAALHIAEMLDTHTASVDISERRSACAR